MAELKFNCPGCNQPIACDELWSGHQIQCPGCQVEITVPSKLAAAPAPAPAAAPGNSLVPQPPGTAAPKLSLGRPQHQATAPSAPPAKPAPLSGPTRRLGAPAPAPKKSGAMKLVKIAVVLLLVAVGGYFTIYFVRQYQEKLNAKSREAEKNSDGGEAGHIANLYSVLDATDPDKHSSSSRRSAGTPARQTTAPRSIPVTGGAPGAAAPAASAVEKELPLLPAVWTLEIASAKIPEGRANGMLSGTNFVPDTARVDPVETAQVLRLIQGTPLSPDREVLIYLHLKAGETLAGHSWTINKEMKGADVPRVAKRWKTNPRYAATLKPFATGYAMKLELGPMADGVLPGRIFLALPDTEQSFVAGLFKVSTNLAAATSDAAQTPAMAPNAAPAAAADKTAFDKRYGIGVKR